jgi:hypothetical protein
MGSSVAGHPRLEHPVQGRRRLRRPRAGGVLGLALGLGAATPAFAGPQYVTSDAQPTPLGLLLVYGFVSGTRTPGVKAGQTGLDFNYGATKDLQLTAVIPAAYDHTDGATHVGMGVVQLAAMYRFLRQEQAGVDVAVFPRVFLPSPEPGFSSRRVNVFLPVWADKNFGKWEVFGGGGYYVNPGPGNRNYWRSGLAATRAVGDRATIGAEIYHHTATATGARPFTGLNLAATYKLTDRWSVVASGGPGIQNARQQGQYAFFVALVAAY